ncbi:hypothetical protein [Streptomyces sp. NPDC001070]
MQPSTVGRHGVLETDAGGDSKGTGLKRPPATATGASGVPLKTGTTRVHEDSPKVTVSGLDSFDASRAAAGYALAGTAL